MLNLSNPCTYKNIVLGGIWVCLGVFSRTVKNCNLILWSGCVSFILKLSTSFFLKRNLVSVITLQQPSHLHFFIHYIHISFFCWSCEHVLHCLEMKHSLCLVVTSWMSSLLIHWILGNVLKLVTQQLVVLWQEWNLKVGWPFWLKQFLKHVRCLFECYILWFVESYQLQLNCIIARRTVWSP